MEKREYIIPGVKKIGIVKRSELSPNIAYRNMAGIIIPIYADICQIATYGDVDIEINCSNLNNGKKYTTKIEFVTDNAKPCDGIFAFVVETNDGKYYLVGYKEPPFVEVKWKHKIGNASSQSKTYSVTAELISPYSTWIECKVNRFE